MLKSKIRRFGVIGKPILYSKSPDIFEIIFKKTKKRGLYTRIAVNDVNEAFWFIKELKISGLNVTMPYKESILKKLDSMDDRVKLIKGANTILVKEKKLLGFNTDYDGIVSPFVFRKINLKKKKVLIIGAGGAGRSAICALNKRCAGLTLVNRNSDQARKIAKLFNCQVERFEKLTKIITNFDIIINTVPIKLHLNLKKGQILFDSNYKNRLLSEKEAIKRGVELIKGEEWLINQGIKSFNIFYNSKIDLTNSLKEVFLFDKEIQANKNIALIGFSGAGKTTLGKMFAEKLNWDFLDSDELIEKKQNLKIPEIFKKKGERFFRKCERELLVELIKKKDKVISFGGGIVLDSQNRKSLKKHFTTIWLYAPVDLCLKRIKDFTRPLLKKKRLKTARKIFQKRLNLFYGSSHLIINSSGSMNDILERLHEEILQTRKY